MADIGVFVNGGTGQALKRNEHGHLIPDASVREMHEEARELTLYGAEESIRAEELGFDQTTFTEHHFQIIGAEHSPSPLQLQTYIAARTEEIKLRQVSNIITWHDPIRLAEQVAVLDNMSDGRVEFGIGRGYQTRENETFGQYWGGTVQDEEKNRASFEEKFDIMKRAWTQEFMQYNGQFHHIPPSYTKWHHRHDYEYLADDVSGVDADEVIDWDDDADERHLGYYSQQDGNSKLKQLAVLPQPQQDPYPQVWEPLGSPRSIQFAASNGINGYLTTGPVPVIAQFAKMYYDAAEAAGWPDRRPEYDGEPFKYGWDAERGRGMCTRRPVFLTDAADEDTFETWKTGLEFEWSWYEPFDFYTPELFSKHTGDDSWYDHEGLGYPAELIVGHDIAIAGTADEVVEKLRYLKEEVGFEDFTVDVEFGGRGLDHEVTMNQMEAFAEDVLPHVNGMFPTPAR